MNNRFFKLFANCILVKGPTKSIICDLFRDRYRDVPNELYPLFEDEGTVDLDKIQKDYPNKDDQEGIKLFLNYFVENDWAFFTDTPSYFPQLEMEWQSPSKVTNAIIDFDACSTYDLKQSILDLNDLGCTGIQFRFYTPTNPEQFETIAETTLNSEFEYIEIVTVNNDAISAEFYTNYVTENRRISKVIVTNTTNNQKAENEKVIFISNKIDYANECGIINPSYFTTNIEHFSEAKQFNTCLNKKIGIDTNGNIKNCPSMKESHGKFGHQSLHEIIEKTKFKESWNMSKDNIITCKDCEYRYICSDCRAFTKDNEKNQKPSKCSYDPYTGVWK